MTRAIRAGVVLCAAQLAACEGFVGIKDLVPVDADDTCRKREPVDFATMDLGILDADVGPMHMVDITADGKRDLVYVYLIGGSVYGRFKRNITAAGGSPAFAANDDELFGWHGGVSDPFVDINGDGKVDIILNPAADGRLNTTPSGSVNPAFAPAFTVDMGGTPNTGLTAARLNADNRPDLIAWSGTDAHIRANTTAAGSATISFAAMVNVTLAPTGYQVSEVQVGDINSDGKPDLIAASQVPDTYQTAISVALNTTGTGALSFAPRVDFLQVLRGPLQLAVSDIDHDGVLDIVVGGSDGVAKLRLLRNTTPALATTPTFATLPLEDLVFEAIRDIDGDGKPDIVYYSGATRSVVVRRNATSMAGMPQFEPVMLFTTVPVAADVVRLAGIDDVNGDGKPDLAMLSRTATGIAMILWTSGSHCPP